MQCGRLELAATLFASLADELVDCRHNETYGTFTKKRRDRTGPVTVIMSLSPAISTVNTFAFRCGVHADNRRFLDAGVVRRAQEISEIVIGAG